MAIAVYTERSMPNGKVRRRYQVTLTDLLGNEHTQIVGMFTHDHSDDGSAVETALLESKKQQEVERYKSTLREGANPFDGDELWNTRAELLKPILDDALSLPPTDPLVYNGLPLLALVTDAELAALYGQDQAWVDSVRAKAAALLAAKAEMDAYEAVL